MKILVFHALMKQGSSWYQLLQQKFSQEGMSKSVEEQKIEVHSEGSERKEKEKNTLQLKTNFKAHIKLEEGLKKRFK